MRIIEHRRKDLKKYKLHDTKTALITLHDRKEGQKGRKGKLGPREEGEGDGRKWEEETRKGVNLPA